MQYGVLSVPTENECERDSLCLFDTVPPLDPAQAAALGWDCKPSPDPDSACGASPSYHEPSVALSGERSSEKEESPFVWAFLAQKGGVF